MGPLRLPARALDGLERYSRAMMGLVPGPPKYQQGPLDLATILGTLEVQVRAI